MTFGCCGMNLLVCTQAKLQIKLFLVLMPNSLECVSSLRSSSFYCQEAPRKKVSVKCGECGCILFDAFTHFGVSVIMED